MTSKGSVVETLRITDKDTSAARARNAARPTEPDVPKLARLVRAYAPHDGTFDLRIPGNMSVSSFHEHFKSVTSMSPRHYQKALRLQEARRRMLSDLMDASTASRLVGYLSASQFSRDYGWLFGSAPTKDIARLRQDAQLSI